MFEQLITLFTRGVVALEIIAEAMAGQKAATDPEENGTAKSTGKGKKADKSNGKKEEADDDDGEKEEKKEKKGKKSKKDPVREKRDEIAQLAAIISGGDEDDASDDFADLLEEYGVKAVGKLEENDLEDFAADLRDIVDQYYEVE